MGGRIIETLRAFQRPNGGGNFFGTGQTQFFTPKFAVSTYAVTSLSPGTGFYVSLLYRIRFTKALHPNAFLMTLIHQGDPILAAQLDGGYIDTGFGDDGSLLVAMTTAKPLQIRVANLDTVPQMWSADFDTLTIQSAQDWEIALDLLNGVRPDIAAILAKGDPYSEHGTGMAPMGAPGGQRPQQDTFGNPLHTPDASTGGIRGDVGLFGGDSASTSSGGIRGGGP